MIKLYDIVDAANKCMHEDKGILVLHRSLKQHPKFKVYKKFCYYLYLVKDNNKELQLEWINTVNCPAEDLSEMWDVSDKEFLTKLISWIANNYDGI